MITLKKKPGYRNEKELTKEEIEEIIDEYYKGKLRCNEISEKFLLTKRALGNILKEKGIKSHRKNRYNLNENYFEVIDTEEKAYWLGFIYADGYIGDKRYNNIVFSQKEDDGYIIEQFAKDIGYTGEVRVSKPNNGSFANAQPQVIINFSSSKMVDDLYNLNKLPIKTQSNSNLPPIENKLIRHFIRGYFDGDGSISETLRTYKNSVYKNYTFSIIGTIDFIQNLRKIIPIKTSICKSHTPGMIYLRSSNNKDISTLYYYLYDDATRFLQRKQDIFLKATRYVREKSRKENGINPDEGVSA